MAYPCLPEMTQLQDLSIAEGAGLAVEFKDEPGRSVCILHLYVNLSGRACACMQACVYAQMHPRLG